MPSTTETLGFVVLEAMASGCPVVAARAGGIPDLVEHGQTGHLFEPDAPETAIEALRELLARPGLRRFYAEQGRKRAEACSWQRETRKLVLEYRKAVVLASQRGVLGRLARVLVG
jgi:glycosyltransferase involved in cell wall biosynthesis